MSQPAIISTSTSTTTPVSAIAENAPLSSGFTSLGLIEPLLRALRDEGHAQPTPIQEKAIPHALADRDLFGCAQTGTGKTAAFVLPILQRLVQRPAPQTPQQHIRALVLAPTRELAAQIARGFEGYGRYTDIRHTVVYGGVGMQGQARALRRGVDVLVATPGRLVDLMSQGIVKLSAVEVLVLDEADRMLDHGFLPSLQRIIRTLPQKRQTLFFSATMPAEIQPLADRMLNSPVHVEAAPTASTPDRVKQAVYCVDQRDKRALLQHLMQDPEITRAVVFTRTKHGADRVARQLAASSITSEAIHGNKSQNARERALTHFRAGQIRVLVATDVAARGIDISGISHVINYDVPNDPEGYVHRIGRTARAGTHGQAISFCSSEERPRLTSIERLIKHRVPVVQDHPYPPQGGAAAQVSDARPPRRSSPSRHQRSPQQARRAW